MCFIKEKNVCENFVFLVRNKASSSQGENPKFLHGLDILIVKQNMKVLNQMSQMVKLTETLQILPTFAFICKSFSLMSSYFTLFTMVY